MDKTKFVFGYLLIFLGVFILSVVYPMIPTAVNYILPEEGFSMPQNTYTTAANSTIGIQSVSSSFGLLGLTVAIFIVIGTLLTTFGGMSMGAAIE